MRTVVFIIFALLVLGGGVAGGYFYFHHPANAAGGEGDDNVTDRQRADSRSSVNHSFVELDPLMLPVINERGARQMVSIVVVIEVSDERKAASVERMAPRLKDAFIQDMYGILSHQAAMRDGVVQVGIVKQRLNKVSRRIMGDDMIEDVLLQVVQQRRL